MRKGNLALCVAVGLALTGCSASGDAGGGATSGGSDDRTIKIGLFLPSVGPFAGFSTEQETTFRQYVDDLRGGELSGYEVEIVRADTRNDPAAARQGLRSLVEGEEVDLVVGIMSSAVAYSVGPYVAEQGVPLIVSAAAADDITQRQSAPNINRVPASASQSMLAAGDYACSQLEHRTATLISLDYSFGWETIGGFAKAYTDAGCTINQELYTPLDTNDWSSIVRSVDPTTELIVYSTTGPDSGRLLRAVHDAGLEVPLMAFGAATDETNLGSPELRELAEGVKSVWYWNPLVDRPIVNEFVNWHEGLNGGVTPGTYPALSYTIAMVIEEALNGLGEEGLNYDSLAEAIRAVELEDTPQGPLTFDSHGQARVSLFLQEMQPDSAGDWHNVVVDQVAEDAGQFWTYDPEEYVTQPPYTELKGTWAN